MPTDMTCPWLVRVCDAVGNTKGTGFLVTENQVFTCAHVIGSDREICLQFPSSDTLYQAVVLEEHWHPVNQGDLALLTIESPPVGIKPVTFARDMPARGTEFESWGYPRNANFELRHTEGTVCPLPNSNGDYDLQLHEPLIITNGFSGAPVFDKTGGNIIGVVVAFDPADKHGRFPHSSLGISIDKVFKFYPHLRPSPRSLQEIQEDYRSVTLARSVYITVDDYLEESFRDSFGSHLQDIEARLEHESQVCQALCPRWDNELPNDLQEALSEVAVRCGLPRWWDVEVIDYLAQYADIGIVQRARPQARKLFRWLSTSPLIPKEVVRKGDDQHPCFIPELRSGTHRYVKTQSRRTWREIHNGLSDFWEGLYQDYGLESRMNAIYHKTCAQPRESLQDILVEICQRLLSATRNNHAEISSYLEGICAVLRDVNCLIEEPELSHWQSRFESTLNCWRNLGSFLEHGADDEPLYYPKLLDSFWIPLTESEQFQQPLFDEELRKRIWQHIGNLYKMSGRLDKAEFAFDQVGDSVAALIELGDIHLQKADQRTQEAEQLTQKARQRTQEAAQLIQEADRLTQEADQRTQEAEQLIQKAGQRTQEAAQLIQEADRLTQEADRLTQEAEQRFRKALDLEQDAKAQLGLILAQSRYDLAQAENMVEQAVAHYGDNKAFVLEKAHIKRQLGKFEEARENYRKVIELGVGADEAWAVYLLWLTTSKQSDCNSDIVDASTWLIAQVSDDESQLREWYKMRAEAYRKLGDEEKAKWDSDFVAALPSEGEDN